VALKHRIVFSQEQLFGGGLWILARGVENARASERHQFDNAAFDFGHMCICSQCVFAVLGRRPRRRRRPTSQL
jgi:hypothetical protein